MFSRSGRATLETVVEESDTRYGFTWVNVDGKYLLRTPDDRFKEVPKVVVETLKAEAADTPIEELIAETAEMRASAADVLRKMHEEGFIREGEPVERVRSPADVRFWSRALGVGLLFCLAGLLWVDVVSTLSRPVLKNPLGYLLSSAPVAIPLIAGSFVVHEYGHYRTARSQGLDPDVGLTLINGVIPAVVTRTHAGWCLPRNRRLWNTLAGPAYGIVWTLGVFALYHTGLAHPGVAVAAVLCFNLQFVVLLPVFHGDGYLLLTDLLDEQNLRKRGLSDVRNRRFTWAAAYVAVSYGMVGAVFAVNLAIGYFLGDSLGAGLVIALSVGIYTESRLEIVGRVREAMSSDG